MQAPIKSLRFVIITIIINAILSTTNATACGFVHFFFSSAYTSYCNHIVWQLFNKHFAINSTDTFLIRCCDLLVHNVHCTLLYSWKISTEIRCVPHTDEAATTTTKINENLFGFSMERVFPNVAQSTSWKPITATTTTTTSALKWMRWNFGHLKNELDHMRRIHQSKSEEMVFSPKNYIIPCNVL